MATTQATTIQPDRLTSENSSGTHSHDRDALEKKPSGPDQDVVVMNELPHEGPPLLADDEYTPFDMQKGDPLDMSDVPEETGPALTVRALAVGTLLGLVVAASNVYLGLMTGFTFGASLFGSLLGAAIIKSICKLPIIGGHFGPRENVTIQSTATASGGLTGQFVSAIPALYRLGLLKDPASDFGRLFTLTLACAFFGPSVVPPFRKFYILKQKLVFPTPSATAFTIRALHSVGTGDITLKKKTRCLIIAMVASIVFCVVNTYAAGIIKNWYVFYWLYQWGWKGALSGNNYGWAIELTPAFIGAGMLSGTNASYSYLFGAVLAWGIMAPSLVATRQAFGIQSDENPYSWSYLSMKGPVDGQYRGGVSPRYWLLWPGVSLMLFASLGEVLVNGKPIAKAITGMAKDAYAHVRHRANARLGRATNDEKASPDAESDIYDPAPPSEQVPLWWCLMGILVTSAITMGVCGGQYQLNVGNTVLSLILAALFLTVGVTSSGATDINPVSICAKASQLIIGGVVQAEGIKPVGKAQMENLIAGSISASAASHGVDMLGDMKTGHLLGASPRVQFWAMLFGSVWAIPFSVGIFVLFTKAYPCINDATLDKCKFSLPAVSAWVAVTEAVTKSNAIPSLLCGLVALFLGLFAFALVFVRQRFFPKRYHKFFPNFNAAGLAFVTPQLYYPIAMAIGATIVHFWMKKNPRNFDLYCYALAGGMVAGEGLAGVINAVLTICNVDGGTVGTTVGIPPW